MRYVGAHLSIADGLEKLQEKMDALESNACGLFLRNQRRFVSKPLDPAVVSRFHAAVQHPERLLPHGSYLINLANPAALERSYAGFLEDLRRCKALGIPLYNFHPGADVATLGTQALALIAQQINRAHAEVADVTILLENMAGQGRCIGSRFEELRDIIALVNDKSRIGVTLDTCHLFGAGYDIRTTEEFAKTMDAFDKIVGAQYLRAMHLNDSKCPLGSRRDRHASLGKGLIGLEAFKYVMSSPRFDNMPLILETPDESLYKEEIALLFSYSK